MEFENDEREHAIKELLNTVNDIITPSQFSGNTTLLTFAVEALCAEYLKPNTRLSIILVIADEDFTVDASYVLAKLFDHAGGGFETCHGMDQVTSTKVIFLETILATVKANPTVVMSILKKDLDVTKTELAAARSKISVLQTHIQKAEEDIRLQLPLALSFAFVALLFSACIKF
jgi:hypothetical protein